MKQKSPVEYAKVKCKKMADVKPSPAPKMQAALGVVSKGKKGKNVVQEDPYSNARVRAIFDPEQAELITSKLEEIQLSGATVTITPAVEGCIERITTVGGTPEVVGKVYWHQIFIRSSC